MFSFTSCQWPRVSTLVNWGWDGSSMHYRKKAMWRRQCYTLGILSGKLNIRDQEHPFTKTIMTEASFGRIMHPALLQKFFRNGFKNIKVPIDSRVLSPIKYFWEMLDKLIRFRKTLIGNLLDWDFVFDGCEQAHFTPAMRSFHELLSVTFCFCMRKSQMCYQRRTQLRADKAKRKKLSGNGLSQHYVLSSSGMIVSLLWASV